VRTVASIDGDDRLAGGLDSVAGTPLLDQCRVEGSRERCSQGTVLTAEPRKEEIMEFVSVRVITDDIKRPVKFYEDVPGRRDRLLDDLH
jgi:hypothetical protein